MWSLSTNPPGEVVTAKVTPAQLQLHYRYEPTPIHQQTFKNFQTTSIRKVNNMKRPSLYILLNVGHRTWADSWHIVGGHLQCMQRKLFRGNGTRGEIA